MNFVVGDVVVFNGFRGYGPVVPQGVEYTITEVSEKGDEVKLKETEAAWHSSDKFDRK